MNPKGLPGYEASSLLILVVIEFDCMFIVCRVYADELFVLDEQSVSLVRGNDALIRRTKPGLLSATVKLIGSVYLSTGRPKKTQNHSNHVLLKFEWLSTFSKLKYVCKVRFCSRELKMLLKF